MALIAMDLETIPAQPEEFCRDMIAETITHPAQMSKPDTIKAWHEGKGDYAGVKDSLIEKKYRDTALDGSQGSICCIAWALEDAEPEAVFAYPGKHSEAEILTIFFDVVRKDLGGRPPYFIGHFVSGFDLRFLYQRAVINKVKPGFNIGHLGRHDKDYYDTMIAWAGYKDSISQKNLCKALGIYVDETELEGSQVWDAYKAGEFDRIRDHALSDVRKVQEVYKRLTFRN